MISSLHDEECARGAHAAADVRQLIQRAECVARPLDEEDPGTQSKQHLVALTLLQGSLLGQISWGTLQAGVMVSMIPCVIIYAVLQRYYVAGMLSGGIK